MVAPPFHRAVQPERRRTLMDTMTGSTGSSSVPRSGYSNEKILFQSFFMLITVQFFFLASS